MYLVGEPIPQDVNDVWTSKKTVFNMYGPTEGTCGATIKQLRPGEMVTIGGPNPSTRVYILNSKGQLGQPGMIGEICIAGIQVSQGYLNLPEQTRERFRRDPVMGGEEGESQTMMYQTGDRGYWNEAGEIVCLGRDDRQIKLRGYRLDMNDLEIRIARAVPALKGVAVARSGDELVLVVRPASTDTHELRAVLSSALPFYAVPQHIVATDHIPITKVGKIDYKATVQQYEAGPELFDDPQEDQCSGQAPATPLEDIVATAWRVVLRLADDVPIDRHHSHFASLGGDSLSQIRLSSRLSSELGVRVPLQSVIAHPTVESLAANLEELVSSTSSVPVTLSSRRTLGDKTPSPIETEWLRRYDMGRGSESFNVSFAADFDEGTIDVARLAQAWDVVLGRHQILRCRYKADEESQNTVKTYTDAPPRAELVANIDLKEEVNRPFEPAAEAPVRVSISKDQLLVVMSHLVADYTTMSVLLREVSALYANKALEPVLRTYADATVWGEPARSSHQRFWDDYLGGNSAPTTGFDIRRPRDESAHDGQSSFFLFEEPAWRTVEQYALRANVTLQQMALGAVAVVLENNRAASADIDIVIGAPYMNRRLEEDAETVGLFLEPIPIRIRPGIQSGQSDAASSPFMASVRQSVQDAVSHAMPWDQLLRLRGVDPSSVPFHPIFDAMVTFHDSDMIQSLAMPDLPGLLRPRYVWSRGAKFLIMAEFVRVNEGRLLLRLEYDDSCLSSGEIKSLLRDIPSALVLLAEGLDAQQVRERLSTKQRDDSIGAVVDEDRVFGARFSEM